MKREFKFRAWNNWGKRVLHWQELEKGVDLAYLFNDANNPDENSWQLMQYTGLKDRNGKEIYEGDIIRNLNTYYEKGYENTIAKVIFKDGKFIETYWGNDLKDYKELEVIGNIYQNPELLEKMETKEAK